MVYFTTIDERYFGYRCSNRCGNRRLNSLTNVREYSERFLPEGLLTNQIQPNYYIMNRTITATLGGLAVASMLLAAAPAFAATHSRVAVAGNARVGTTSPAGAERGERERAQARVATTSSSKAERGRILSACLKTAATTRNTALHTAQNTFRQSMRGTSTASTTVATSTTKLAMRYAARNAYVSAVRAAQTAFSTSRKACLQNK